MTPICSPEAAWSFLALVKAYGTLAVAIIVGAIAFAQWRLARRKIALDLFKARFDAYEELRAAIGSALPPGLVELPQDAAFVAAHHKAEFLFGPELTARTKQVMLAIGRIYSLQRGETMQDQVARLILAQGEVTSLQADLQALVSPYLEFHDRPPRRLRAWLHSLANG